MDSKAADQQAEKKAETGKSQGENKKNVSERRLVRDGRYEDSIDDCWE